MADKMEVLTLLLMFLTVPGYSYVFQPKTTVTQIADLDGRNHQSELRDVFMSVEERENEKNGAAESLERPEEEQGSEGVSPETNPVRRPVEKEMTVVQRGQEETPDRNPGYERGSEERFSAETFSKSIISGEETKTGEFSDANRVEGFDQMEKLRQEILEERESELVAGINLHEEHRINTHEDQKILMVKKEMVAKEGGNQERAEKGDDIKNAKHDKLAERDKADHILVPLLSISSAQVGRESETPATIEIITQSQNPPPPHHHNVPPLYPITPTQVPPHFSFPPAVPNPTLSTVVPVEVRSVSLLEDVLINVLHKPGHYLNQNQLEARVSPNSQDEMDKNILLKPAQKELQTTWKAQEINVVVQKESEFTPTVHAAMLKPKEAKFIIQDLNTEEPNPTPKSNENIFMAKLVKLTRKPNTTQPTGEPIVVNVMENDTELALKQTKASLPRPQLTKPSAKPLLATARAPSTRPMKINRSKNKTIRKSKEKKRKKDNKTRKPPQRKKEVTTPVHFPYFKDNYCPPECACYGRVVQCSDKGVEKVPYGIPYNARYILLMNNHINSIQLDLLNEYTSMEFLVLSNNQLTDGTIEGVFEGVPALKRLYLDRNLLESVPVDLPFSLEELRLDNNQLGVMSEAAWAQCTSLLILSLSNNSLGNTSESLPSAVFSPLCNLRTLNLDYNQLKSVPLGLPLSIKELYLKGNLIERFHGEVFNGTAELVVLDLSANRLSNKGLVKESLLNATHLESLNLAGNRLKQVPRHLPLSLKTLNLEGNLISSINRAAFSTLKNLEHLGLARNKIVKVAPGAFRTLPALHQLDLCHNTLRQVPRQLPQGLHSVALTHNKIQSVPRDAFCWGNKTLSPSWLVLVQLEHNLIDMGKLDARAFRCLRGFQVVHFY